MSLSSRTRSFISVVGGLAGTIALLISLALALPSKYTVPGGGVHCSAGFKIDWCSASSGAEVVSGCDDQTSSTWKVGLFSGVSILSASGSVTDASGEHVWVFLRDCYGRYYLQYPSPVCSGGRWDMANIRVGREIAAIEFWGVNDAGDKALQSKAGEFIDAGKWLGLPKSSYPTHSDLGSIALLYGRGFPYVF